MSTPITTEPPLLCGPCALRRVSHSNGDSALFLHSVLWAHNVTLIRDQGCAFLFVYSVFWAHNVTWTGDQGCAFQSMTNTQSCGILFFLLFLCAIITFLCTMVESLLPVKQNRFWRFPDFIKSATFVPTFARFVSWRGSKNCYFGLFLFQLWLSLKIFPDDTKLKG